MDRHRSRHMVRLPAAYHKKLQRLTKQIDAPMTVLVQMGIDAVVESVRGMLAQKPKKSKRR